MPFPSVRGRSFLPLFNDPNVSVFNNAAGLVGVHGALGFETGSFYSPAHGFGGELANVGGHAINTLYYWPFYGFAALDPDQLVICYTANGGAGSRVRVGVYSDVNGTPGSLLTNFATGEIVTDAGAPLVQGFIIGGGTPTTNRVPVAPGAVVWMAAVIGTASPTVTVVQNYQPMLGVRSTGTAFTTGYGRQVAFAYAALPASAPAPTGITTVPPFVFFRAG